tara:strand:- start:129986 stop:133330 length:3345 start_codon:yes stop_codon:yes gene_type:complete
LSLIKVFILFILASCSSVEKSRYPSQYIETQESIFKAQVPLSTFKEAFAEISHRSDFIQKVYHLNMDPVTRILSVGLTINSPLKNLLRFQEQTGTRTAESHNLDIEVAFPSVNALTAQGYLRLQFKKFTIDGKSYLNHFQIVSDVTKTILANTSLVEFLYHKVAGDDNKLSYKSMLTDVIENNGIIIFPATRTLAFRLNAKRFEQLKYLSHLKELRLWILSPFLLKGTNEVFFRLEAGLGRPASVWLSEMQARVEDDKEKLLNQRSTLYKQYSNLEDLDQMLKNYLETLISREGLDENKLSNIHRNNLLHFRSTFTSEAREILSLSNESFKANPENEYLQYLEAKKNEIRNFVVDLNRKTAIEYNTLMAGNQNDETRPFLVKKVSQDMLTAGMNFLKDGTSWVKESNLVVAPQLPGVIFKGVIGVPLKDLLSEKEEGLILHDGLKNLTPIEEGIPFELVVETQTEDNGWLSLDAKSITLFEGAKALHFARNDNNDKFFLDLLKLTVVQSLAGLSFELEKDEDTEEKKERELKKLKSYVESLRASYDSSIQESFIDSIKQTISTDIIKNPFTAAGQDYVNAKKEILFGRIFKYDPKDKLFKIQLDPKLVAENISGAKNDIQVWNVSPVFLESQNNTYLELSAGKGRRSTNYIRQVHNRQNSQINAGFSGLQDDHQRSSADLITTFNFDYLESAANRILKEIAENSNGEYKQELKKDEEQTHYIINSLAIDILSSESINLELNATKLSKSQKGFWMWKEWKVEKESYGVSAQISLESREFEQVKGNLREHKDELYFSDKVIALKIHNARVKFGKKSLINSALNAMANVNLEGAIGSRVRSFVLKLLNDHFVKSYTESKEEILGQKHEKFIRVFTTSEDIILMLNPRMSGSAFELELAGDRDFIEQALSFNSETQEMTAYLTGSPAMAKTDKRDLLDIIKETEQIFSPMLAKTKWPLYHALKKPGFVEKVIYDNDSSKLSVYNKLLEEIKTYDQVLNTINIPIKAPNSMRRISACGSELMYFAGASFTLFHALDQLVKKIDDNGLENHVHMYDTMVEARHKLFNNIITPLLRTYKERFHPQNRQLKKSKESHWNVNFYPDAIFSETIYNFLDKAINP